MFRAIVIILGFALCLPVRAQPPVSKDSFFPARKRLPKNYKTEISESKWFYKGTYRSDNGKIVLPDSPQPAVIVFENGENYRKIRSKKIISNKKADTQKIIYLDDESLILEARDENGRYRSLYRKQKKSKQEQ